MSHVPFEIYQKEHTVVLVERFATHRKFKCHVLGATVAQVKLDVAKHLSQAKLVLRNFWNGALLQKLTES